ncbi:hypothetical protein [Roseiterribacter gracilis]|uniref:Uncharacterized protein n=1 Tax=Roseiterribacter gracilis TaxID=2812848 RepID=A0A8S8X7H5_9PROT|nr:hypothetical protein TMPK1_05910 [Rhodospirillales bacterium TMPK1]
MKFFEDERKRRALSAVLIGGLMILQGVRLLFRPDAFAWWLGVVLVPTGIGFTLTLLAVIYKQPRL